MGRSRGNFHADEDPSQRSRRRKNAANGENIESVGSGQGIGEGKKALYHCNYCNKDITGRIRIKCAVCSDFDLCIECFSVGAEMHPHKSNHPYRVMDVLSFPLICPDWKADEEILLLEGIEMYGMGNWAEIGEHVGTKTKEICIEHYRNAYLNSPCFPLPDMTHVIGKNRKELLAMAKGHTEEKKGLSLFGEFAPESPFSPSRVRVEDSHKSSPSGRLLSGATAGTKAKEKDSNSAQVKDQQDSLKPDGRNVDSNKDKTSKVEGSSSLMALSGYNIKRQDFDPEYDNDAEHLLADMEFKENDTEEEREIKLRVLRLYSKRLDERKRRKDFVLDRNLLHQNSFEKDLSREENTLCRKYDAFMRFHSKEEHEECMKAIVSEHRIMKRIQALEEAHAAGCHSIAEADRYFEQKRKRETEENGSRKENCLDGRISSRNIVNASVPSSDLSNTYSNQRILCQSNLGSFTVSDPMDCSDAEILSAAEKRLCRENNLSPQQYLEMQEAMTIHIFSGNITKKSDAYSFFKAEPAKIDKVYDILQKKGIAPF